MPADLSKVETLHTRLIDSRDGYAEARDRAEDGAVKMTLAQLMTERAAFADRIRTTFMAQGKTLDDDGSILAAAHRTFMDLRDMVGKGDQPVLSEIVRGEEQLLTLYSDAIEQTAGHPEWAFLAEQRAAVQASIGQVKTRAEV